MSRKMQAEGPAGQTGTHRHNRTAVSTRDKRKTDYSTVLILGTTTLFAAVFVLAAAINAAISLTIGTSLIIAHLFLAFAASSILAGFGAIALK